MSIIGNLLMLPLKLLVLPFFLFFAFLTVITGLIKGISKLLLGFLSLITLALAVVGFFTGTPFWIPMLVCFLALSLIPAILGIFPFFFRNISAFFGKFLRFWF